MSIAQIKVGETYKATNGTMVRIINEIAGGFVGTFGSGVNEMRLVMNTRGVPLGTGWSDFSIEDTLLMLGNQTTVMPPAKFHPGKRYTTRSGSEAGIDQVREDGALMGWIHFEMGRVSVCWHSTGRMHPTKDDPSDLMPSQEDTPLGVTSIEDITPADRLDALESQCRDIFRQLRNMRGLRGEMAETAADMAAKVSELVERLDGTDRRVAAINEGLTDGGDVILKHEDRIVAVEKFDQNLSRRISSLESTLARIEDCLTAEKPSSIPNPMNVPVPKGFVANHPDLPACGNPACGQCYSPRKSLGWINVFTVTDQSSILARGGPRINGPFNTKAEAMACREDRPILRHAACVEIFEGDGI